MKNLWRLLFLSTSRCWHTVSWKCNDEMVHWSVIPFSSSPSRTDVQHRYPHVVVVESFDAWSQLGVAKCQRRLARTSSTCHLVFIYIYIYRCETDREQVMCTDAYSRQYMISRWVILFSVIEGAGWYASSKFSLILGCCFMLCTRSKCKQMSSWVSCWPRCRRSQDISRGLLTAFNFS